MHEGSICLIPARGGSKRIPRKNIRPLNGKPLIAYTIEAAINSSCFEDVIVSSDDHEILAVAEEYGAKTDFRPKVLSGDKVKAVEVVDEFLHRPRHRGKWTAIAMCLPTCPFRTAEDVSNAVESFLKGKNACPRLIGVTKCDFPPQLALTKADDTSYIDMREPDAYGFSTRSQDCQDFYFPNGSIYISTVDDFLKSKTFFGRPMLSYIMPAERSFDIDYPFQFQIAECMMQAI
ncbi:acylneuraminate cytidylyltransferase family protein [bacterium]|nr:acylneuraminate cytidylyltransferase family protein [bacterium]